MFKQESYVILYGFLLALGLILPLGMQNSFILMVSSQSKSFIRILPIIITASLCDTCLILLAVMGVSLLILKVIWLKIPIIILGMLTLIYMAFKSLQIKGKNNNSIQDEFSYKFIMKQIMFTLSVSILNPFALLDTILVIGSNAESFDNIDKYLFTGACIVVSWVWFFFLAKIGFTFGEKFRNSIWWHYLVASIIWINVILFFYRFIKMY